MDCKRQKRGRVKGKKDTSWERNIRKIICYNGGNPQGVLTNEMKKSLCERDSLIFG